MSVTDVLESTDRSGDAARAAAAEETAVRSALRAEVARAGSLTALGVEWGMSAQYLGKVLNGRMGASSRVRDRLGFGRLPARAPAAPNRVRPGRHRSTKLAKNHVRVPRPSPAKAERAWPYPLRPVVLNIFAIEKELRRWASEAAPAQIRQSEDRAATGGEGWSGS